MISHRMGFPSVVKICAHMKHLGCAAARRIRLYGEKFKVVSDPMSSIQWGCSSDDEERPTHSATTHSGGCASERRR
jgi:hypothetical protein